MEPLFSEQKPIMGINPLLRRHIWPNPTPESVVVKFKREAVVFIECRSSVAFLARQPGSRL
jgi:hypothetical protein